MVVNPDKFQFIIINRPGKLKDSYELLIDDHKIDSGNFVTLLGIEIDNELNFEKHVTKMKMLLDSSIFSHFNDCSQVSYFYSTALSQKIEEIQERALKLLYSDSYSSYNSLLLNDDDDDDDDDDDCFCVWLTDKRCLGLFPAGTTDRDPHHRESLTRREQDLNLRRT